MEDTWRNVPNSSDVDFQYVSRKKWKKKRGKKHSEQANVLNKTGQQDDVVEETANGNDERESEDSTVLESDEKEQRLMYDATVFCLPKYISSTSIDEDHPPVSQMGQHSSTPRVNTKALAKEAKTYELEKFQKNYLIIFNQEKIDGFEPRLGTAQDVDILTETFEYFGFEVKECKDYTKERIIAVLDTFKTKNFTDYGCVGVVVLTHGSSNGLLRAKDQVYSETEIINYFKVHDKPTLITKPKFLIIQACRGNRRLPGVTVAQSSNLREDLDKVIEPYTLPVTADTLVVHSSYIGEISIRDENHGSWFIQTLCRKINELSHTDDIESILTEMKRAVAAERSWEDYNSHTNEMETYKQMPTVTSTLIRKLFLRRYGEECLPSYPDSTPVPSRSAVLETPVTPMLVQFGPCSCFLDHFEYIKKCLLYFTEDNPGDSTARTFLEISNAFEDEDKFNAAKAKMAKAMCDYLINNAREHDFFKYLYFYKH